MPPGERQRQPAPEPGLPSIITIAADPDIDALAVGQLVAHNCNMVLVGADVTASVATRTGLPVDVVAELLWRAVPGGEDLDDDVSTPAWRSENRASFAKNYVLRERRRLIVQLVQGRNVVIVCEGAAEVLAGDPQAVHVFLSGPVARRTGQLPEGRFDIAVTVLPRELEAAAKQIVGMLRQPVTS